MSKRRWWFHTIEPTPYHGTGPFGPIEAEDEQDAERIGRARAAASDLTFDRVEEKPPRQECCGLIYEHGAFTQRHLACSDCPKAAG